jgi:biopolymer transport protein TolR
LRGLGAIVEGSSGSSKGVIAAINIVPLIDILLVLLIIFMVISPVSPFGLRTEVPHPNPAPGEESSSIVVQVLANGPAINTHSVSWDDLGPQLSSIFSTRSEKIAFVNGSDAVDFADVARAVDIMRASGIDRVGFVTGKLGQAR